MKRATILSSIYALKPFFREGAMQYLYTAQMEGFNHFANFALLAFDWYDMHSREEKLARIQIYMDEENLILVFNNDSDLYYCDHLFDGMENFSNEQTLYHFFVNLLRRDMDHLENIENRLDQHMTRILAGDLDQALEIIARERRELIRLKRYYEQLNNVFDDILLDDEPFFAQETLDRINILDARTDRYINKVENLQSLVSQLQDTYQAQLSIQQNDLMKVFTIVTAIFLPLSLLVGWYGMNFVDMPELHWRYGYPAVIVFSAAIVAGLFWYFKHKKWL